MTDDLPKPRLFIGSSLEGLPIAHAAEDALREVAEPTVWTEAAFRPGRLLLETLESKLKEFDFALFVASPDDALVKRDEQGKAMRDNVLFEFGLFMGVLGRRRTYLLLPSDAQLILPVDLGGLLVGRYAAGSPRPLAAAGNCQSLVEAIRTEWAQENEARTRRAEANLNEDKTQAILKLFKFSNELVDLYRAPVHVDPFESVQEKGRDALRKLADTVRRDADAAGVRDELDELLSLAETAIEDLPSSDELWEHYSRMREVVVMRFDPFIQHAGRDSLAEWHAAVRKDISDEWTVSMQWLLQSSQALGAAATREETIQMIERLAFYTLGARAAVTPLREIEERYSRWWNTHKDALVSRLDSFHHLLVERLVTQIDPLSPAGAVRSVMLIPPAPVAPSSAPAISSAADVTSADTRATRPSGPRAQGRWWTRLFRRWL